MGKLRNYDIMELISDKRFIKELREVGESAKVCSCSNHEIDDQFIDEIIYRSDFYTTHYIEDEDDENDNNHDELYSFMYSFIIDYLFNNYDVVLEYNEHYQKYFYVKMVKDYNINAVLFDNQKIDFDEWDNNYLYNEDYIYYALKNNFKAWDFKKLCSIYGECADSIRSFTIDEYKYSNGNQYKSDVVIVDSINNITFYYDERR